MKKWYVYEIVNLMGSVEYVGETSNPKNRWQYHRWKGKKFYKRSDVFFNLVDVVFTNKKDAFQYQCKLQKEYGLISDLDKYYHSRVDLEKPIIAYKNGKFYNEYKSISEAYRQLKLKSIGNISLVLNGKRSHTGGYVFRYK